MRNEVTIRRDDVANINMLEHNIKTLKQDISDIRYEISLVIKQSEEKVKELEKIVTWLWSIFVFVGMFGAVLLLSGCASDIERINSEVNATRPYKTYYARDYRYLKPGEKGNCAAITETKRVELSRIGIPSQVVECKLKDGPYHALLKTTEGYADNRHNFLVSWADTGCEGKEK